MIHLKEIALAINQKLKRVLPAIPTQSKDISEGFDRPALFVDFDEVTTAKYGPVSRERTVSVTIYYFPKDRYTNKIDILEVQETLEQAFSEPLTIRKGFVSFTAELSSSKTDGVLQTSFDLYYIERLDDPEDEDSAEYMEHLDMNLKEES